MWTVAAVLAVAVLVAVLLFRRFQRTDHRELIEKRLAEHQAVRARVLAIVNPISGSKSGKADMDAISASLRARGFLVDTVVTTRGGQCGELLTTLASVGDWSTVDVIAVVGGDGFFFEVLNGVLGKLNPDRIILTPWNEEALALAKPKLAIVPSGTGNGVATSLGIRTPADAAEALFCGRVQPLELMGVAVAGEPEARTMVAALSVAWGAIADHDALTERDLRSMPLKLILVPLWIIMRSNTYVGSVSFKPHARQSPPTRANTCVDPATGRVVIEDAFNLVHICNLPWIATDCYAAPGAAPNDGCFGILIMRGASRLDLLRMFIAAESGTHTSHAAVELYWATEATISPKDGACGRGNIAIDGELVAPSRVDVKCHQSAISVCARCEQSAGSS